MTLIRVGDQPAPIIALAEIFDGESAKAHRDMVRIVEDAAPVLVWSPEHGPDVRLPLDSLRELPDQAAPETLVLTSTERLLLRIIIRDTGDVLAFRARLPSLSTAQPVRGTGRVMGWAAAAVASVAGRIQPGGDSIHG